VVKTAPHRCCDAGPWPPPACAQLKTTRADQGQSLHYILQPCTGSSRRLQAPGTKASVNLWPPNRATARCNWRRGAAPCAPRAQRTSQFALHHVVTKFDSSSRRLCTGAALHCAARGTRPAIYPGQRTCNILPPWPPPRARPRTARRKIALDPVSLLVTREAARGTAGRRRPELTRQDDVVKLLALHTWTSNLRVGSLLYNVRVTVAVLLAPGRFSARFRIK